MQGGIRLGRAADDLLYQLRARLVNVAERRLRASDGN